MVINVILYSNFPEMGNINWQARWTFYIKAVYYATN